MREGERQGRRGGRKISLIVLVAICHSSAVPRPREEAEKGGRPAAATLDKILALASRERRSTSPVRVKGANQGSGGAGREREEKVEHPADDIVSSSRY